MQGFCVVGLVVVEQGLNVVPSVIVARTRAELNITEKSFMMLVSLREN